MDKKAYGDLEPEIEKLLCRYRAKWQLNALAWMDYDDVCQIIRTHIYNKWHLWDQKRAFGPWCSTLISNQIKNLIRNNYGSFAKPCLRCPYYGGGDDCNFTASGVQDGTCLDFSNWKKKKQKAYNIKLPLSLDLSLDTGEKHVSGEVNYNEKIDKIHCLVMEKLSDKHRQIYYMLYVEHKSDAEVAGVFGYKEDSSNRKTPRYKQINNLKKRFYKIASMILRDNDLI
jgi:DNA-directed RNA polymerase specialized sigma24 family protein